MCQGHYSKSAFFGRKRMTGDPGGQKQGVSGSWNRRARRGDPFSRERESNQSPMSSSASLSNQRQSSSTSLQVNCVVRRKPLRCVTDEDEGVMKAFPPSLSLARHTGPISGSVVSLELLSCDRSIGGADVSPPHAWTRPRCN